MQPLLHLVNIDIVYIVAVRVALYRRRDTGSLTSDVAARHDSYRRLHISVGTDAASGAQQIAYALDRERAIGDSVVLALL